MTEWVEEKNWRGQWHVVEPLRGGGQSECYEVTRESSHERYFLKTPKKTTYGARRRFYREADAYFQLSHPRIPRLIESNAQLFKDGAVPLYLVTDFIEGPSLDAHITKNGPLPFDTALELIDHLLEAVEYLHSQDYVHRDIKPKNIILRAANAEDPVLVDFGIAFSESQSSSSRDLTLVGEELGPRFLRLPELGPFSGLQQDARSDVALCAGILFYILTGDEPATLLDASELLPHQRNRQRDKLKATADSKLMKLLSVFDKAFAPNIGKRYATISDLKAAIKSTRTQETKGSTEPTDQIAQRIKERLASEQNLSGAHNRTTTQNAVTIVTNIASNVVTSIASSHYVAGSHGSWQSNTSSALNFGYRHAGDESHEAHRRVEAAVHGGELVVRIGDAEVLRTSAAAPDFHKSFEENTKAVFTRLLEELVEDQR